MAKKINTQKMTSDSQPAPTSPPIDNSIQGTPGGQETAVAVSDNQSAAPPSQQAVIPAASVSSQPAQHPVNGIKPSQYTFVGMGETPDEVINGGVSLDKLQKYTGVDTEREDDLRKKTGLSGQELLNILEKERDKARPETAEEQKKREKREKWARIASAIGDGVSSLANLYFASKGAPNMYNPRTSMSKHTLAMQERLKKEREENRDRYLNYMAKVYGLNNEAYRDELAAASRKYQAINAARRADNEQKEREWKEAWYNARTNDYAVRQQQAQNKIEEAARHNAAMEEIGRTRAANAGKSRSGRGNSSKAKTASKADDKYKYETVTEKKKDHNGNSTTVSYKRPVGSGKKHSNLNKLMQGW